MAIIILSGCASSDEVETSDTSKGYQKITVNTPGQSGAHCFLQSGPRSYTVETPGTALVYKTSDDMDVTCFKGDHLKGSQVVKAMVAPVEAGLKDCISCVYPPTVTVALELASPSFERTVDTYP